MNRGSIAAGQRDKLVTIQAGTEGRGTSGAPKMTWSDLPPQEWLSRRDLTAGERFANAQRTSFAETQWCMRYRADMDPELLDVTTLRRLVYQGRVFNIIAASLMERRVGIELLTMSGGTL